MKHVCFGIYIGRSMQMTVGMVVTSHARHRLALQGQGGEQ
jgi:hypothetical protein